VPEALGGGPVIVRAGKPIFNALEDFGSYHLNGRHPRTAVGQRADGRIVMVVVDGRRRGYSAGMTNFELAQTMIRLGAVTASGLDGGGSSAMAFDGQLLSRPSDGGGERMVAESLNVTYYGVYAPKPEASFSPNGDGAGERQTLAYKIVRPSSITATLTGPGGATRTVDSGRRSPGVYSFNWAGRTDGGPEPEGRWRFAVTAVDQDGKTSSADRSFMLNNTLGFLTVQPSRAVVQRRRGGRIAIRFRLTRPARVSITITSKTGQLLRVVRNAQEQAGNVEAFWDGRYPNRKPVFSGTYVAKVTTTNGAGRSELARSFRVRRR
jgi:Phosphodiester glycosidase/FlgD Ig-like domain